MNGGGKDFLIIVGLVIALGYVAITVNSTGGVSSFSFIAPLAPSTNVSISQNNIPQTKADIERELKTIEVEVAIVEEELKRIEKYGEDSPYKGMVTISKGFFGLSSTDVNREYVTLKASSKNESGVVISKWRIVSGVTGKGSDVGKAAPLVYSGKVNIEQSVIMYAGDKVIVSTGRSPIGTSFKVNKCTGYMSQFQTFTPSLQKNCPFPEEEIDFFDDKTIFSEDVCLDFIDTLQRCQIYTKPLPLTLSNSCMDAITYEVNYNSCIDKHKYDSDFEKPEWRIFLKQSDTLWKSRREVIKLVDENNKLIDMISY